MKKLAVLLSLVISIFGIVLFFAGGWLISLGGSSYYCIMGVVYLTTAWLIIKRRSLALYLLFISLLYTIAWSYYERGLNFWSMIPRIMVPLALTSLGCLLLIRWLNASTRFFIIIGSLSGLSFVMMFVSMFYPHDSLYANGEDVTYPATPNKPQDWYAYGRTPEGIRYAPFTQINRSNVSQLKLAWTYHSGDTGPGIDQNTPLQVDDRVFTCSPNNQIAALDADTGKLIWKVDTKSKSPMWQRCRGVSYYKDSDAPQTALCTSRIIATTIDARLLALDANTGETCSNFGDNGVVNLRKDMGEVKPGYYFQTSAPLVARDKVVIGGWVVDNQEVEEPSGVIRAFDVRSGKLIWAWDLADPTITRDPHPGQSYTRETPNMWTHAAYDDKLGLVFIPLGNTTPDYYGGNRPPFSDRYNSSLVALNIENGREKWHFQTVHHDLWDYDLPSQPALVDVPDQNGRIISAIMQTTKRGQIFLLNRSTGQPVTKVEEKPVPSKSPIKSERISPTQPYSTDMPTIGAQTLNEKSMWGMTMFDQLACRIQFRQLRYLGDFTPIGLQPTIQQPGNLGGMNWGSVSVDKTHNIAYVNDIRIPSIVWLTSREQYPSYAKKYNADGTGHGPSPQNGTPYGMVTMMWMSKLGVPCTEPPFGTISAIDLNSRKLLWQVPAGTSEQLGPLGIKSRLPLPIGLPTYAGTSVTAGGLVLFAGSQDYYLRIYDAASGKELWRYALPVGSSATPMSYISPKTGKQYILLSVGGAAHSADRGDYVMAFSLTQPSQF
ncbi:MAG: membrane-bound PQQ-dependent dehydrogenase, glucose/quinate/shikimate family [Hafnia sp.]